MYELCSAYSFLVIILSLVVFLPGLGELHLTYVYLSIQPKIRSPWNFWNSFRGSVFLSPVFCPAKSGFFWFLEPWSLSLQLSKTARFCFGYSSLRGSLKSASRERNMKTPVGFVLLISLLWRITFLSFLLPNIGKELMYMFYPGFSYCVTSCKLFPYLLGSNTKIKHKGSIQSK